LHDFAKQKGLKELWAVPYVAVFRPCRGSSQDRPDPLSAQYLKRRIPCAPVRDVSEVMHDPHMHERGMLEWIDHDEIGHIVVPTSPLRFHGADKVETTPSPKLGQHNADIYGGWLGLSPGEIADLAQSGVI